MPLLAFRLQNHSDTSEVSSSQLRNNNKIHPTLLEGCSSFLFFMLRPESDIPDVRPHKIYPCKVFLYLFMKQMYFIY